MIKILVISNYSNSLSSRPEAEIFLNLNKNDFSVTVLTDENAEYAKKFKAAGINVIHYLPEKKISRKEIRFIRQILIKGEYQILHVFSGKAIINSISAIRKLPVKLLLYRGYTGNVKWYDPFAYLKYLHPRVDGIVCNSPSVKDSIDRNNLFFKKNTIVITKGHCPSWYEKIVPADLNQLGIKKEQYVFITTGNSRRMKGFHYLLRAVELLPSEAKIVVIFAGGDKGFIQKYSKKIRKNKDKVMFIGYRNDLLSIVSACHAFISSSIKGESFNKSVAEAIMLGKPAIITSVSGNKGMVLNYKTGIVVPPCRARVLTEAMLFFYNHPETAVHYGIEGRQYLTTSYAFRDTVEKLEGYYKSLITNNF